MRYSRLKCDFCDKEADMGNNASGYYPMPKDWISVSMSLYGNVGDTVLPAQVLLGYNYGSNIGGQSIGGYNQNINPTCFAKNLELCETCSPKFYNQVKG